MSETKRKKKYTKKRRIIELRLKFLCFFLVIAALIFGYFRRDVLLRLLHIREAVVTTVEPEEDTEKETSGDEQTENAQTGQSGNGADIPEESTYIKPILAEEDIYTFLQGPKAWGSQTPWSGAWCEEVLAGQKFSVFGCGLCDLANIYSTLTPYDCSPVDMFYYAIDASGYSPGAGFGAIDWIYLKETLESVGFTCEICDKDASYEEFASAMDRAVTAIVLVSSYNDSTYWQSTEGHYVNLWSYNGETDEVFLADSGEPSHNRTWIPLRYVYDALKTSGEHQYLLVTAYEEEKNTWKHTGIEENWIIPESKRNAG